TLKTPRDQLPARISELVANLKAAERAIAQFGASQLAQRVPALVATATKLGAVTFVGENLGAVASADDVRTLVTSVRERLGSEPAVVALGADVGGKPVVIVATNDAARSNSLLAGDLAKAAAVVLGGGGGGKGDLAQGGGTDVSAIANAIDTVAKAIRG
ncbi:MAG: DHHA1 domain-containing protein, partial [Salinibacterium sp.]|nr:DHHA1 domain-containing protein [Salinibacterium sp.]